MSLLNLLKAVDGLLPEDSVTLNDLCSLANVPKSTIGSAIRGLVNRGYLEDRGGMPKHYKRITTESLADAFERGELKGFWTGIYPSTRSKRTPEPEPEPVEEEYELDPMDFFRQIGPEEFGRLVGVFCQGQVGIIEPLRAQVKDLEAEITARQIDKDRATNSLEGEIRALREQLKDERIKTMTLTNTLNAEREKRVYSEERVKTILIRENSQATQQSGGSVGGGFQRIKMHRKPLMTHAPATVIHRHHR